MFCFSGHSGIGDLSDVKKELTPVAAKWKSIGTALRLSPDVLESIQSANRGKPPECLASVVTNWLNTNYNLEKFGEPTWQWLVEAVNHPAGGANTALAATIAKSHKAGGKSRYICTIQGNVFAS